MTRPENVLFIAQIACVSVVISVSLFNLTFQWGNQHLWQIILTSSLAAIMPSPKLKTAFDDFDASKAIKDTGSEENKNLKA